MRTIAVQSWNLKPIKYAWPGGYPVFYIAREGYRNEAGELELSQYDRSEFVCCADCAAEKADRILMASDVNWEDTDLTCEVCSKPIKSAYGESEVQS